MNNLARLIPLEDEPQFKDGDGGGGVVPIMQQEITTVENGYIHHGVFADESQSLLVFQDERELLEHIISVMGLSNRYKLEHKKIEV